MSQTGGAALAGRQPVLRRDTHGRQSTGGRLYCVRRVQVASQPLWHRILLGKERASWYRAAWTVLLDGCGGVGEFCTVVVWRPHSPRERQAGGLAGVGQLLQLQGL